MKTFTPTIITIAFTLLLVAPIVAQTWEQMEKVTSAFRSSGDQFGISVAMSGDYAIVGAYLEDEDANESNPIMDAGAAYMYKREDCDWFPAKKLVAADSIEASTRWMKADF